MVYIFRLLVFLIFIFLIRENNITEKTDGKTVIKAIFISVGFVLVGFAIDELAALIFSTASATLILYIPVNFVINIFSILLLFFGISCIADIYGVFRTNGLVYAILVLELLISVVMNLVEVYIMYTLLNDILSMSADEVRARSMNMDMLEALRLLINFIPAIALVVCCLVKGKKAVGAEDLSMDQMNGSDRGSVDL